MCLYSSGEIPAGVGILERITSSNLSVRRRACRSRESAVNDRGDALIEIKG
jgi:hypothetical protein